MISIMQRHHQPEFPHKRKLNNHHSGGGCPAFNLERANKVQRVTSALKDQRSVVPDGSHPHDYLIGKLKERGVEVSVHSFDSLKDFFADPTPDEIAAYSSELVRAVRSGDIDLLRRLHFEQGRPLKCSNQFGESLLHLACRRQLTDVVAFLVEEAGVTVRVRDDSGRTPLHDACWTTSPNFEIVDLILDQCPDLLYIKDKRGHTPLFYARQNHWQDWIRHLERRIDTLATTTCTTAKAIGNEEGDCGDSDTQNKQTAT